MGRNTELIRQWTILQRIATARGQTIPKLATELSVSTRTIRRDLEALQVAGFPVYDEIVQGDKFWRLDPRAMGALARTGVTLTELAALYFSRAPLPWDRESWNGKMFVARDSSVEPLAANSAELGGDWARHIGIYAYRAEFLHRFVSWPMGRLEQLEKLEQLRALENGVAIHVDESNALIPPGVDTVEDLERVRAVLDGSGAA